MSEISGVLAREVLDSRGRPTVEVEITAGAFRGRAIAPSGASTGAAEAWELRDGGERYDGLGVRQAVDNVNQVISPALVGSDPAKQASVDQILLDLDGTPQKKRLGGNAMLAVSLAASHAAAAMAGVPLHTHFHRLMDEVDESDLQPAMPTPMISAT